LCPVVSLLILVPNIMYSDLQPWLETVWEKIAVQEVKKFEKELQALLFGDDIMCIWRVSDLRCHCASIFLLQLLASHKMCVVIFSLRFQTLCIWIDFILSI
jgi:hypothetical protein